VLMVPPEEELSTEELLPASADAKPAPFPLTVQEQSVSNARRSEGDLVERRLQLLLGQQQLHYDLQIQQLQQQMSQMQLQHQEELQQLLQAVGGGEHAPPAQGESCTTPHTPTKHKQAIQVKCIKLEPVTPLASQDANEEDQMMMQLQPPEVSAARAHAAQPGKNQVKEKYI
jgi:hypothetical protein